MRLIRRAVALAPRYAKRLPLSSSSSHLSSSPLLARWFAYSPRTSNLVPKACKLADAGPEWIESGCMLFAKHGVCLIPELAYLSTSDIQGLQQVLHKKVVACPSTTEGCARDLACPCSVVAVASTGKVGLAESDGEPYDPKSLMAKQKAHQQLLLGGGFDVTVFLLPLTIEEQSQQAAMMFEDAMSPHDQHYSSQQSSLKAAFASVLESQRVHPTFRPGFTNDLPNGRREFYRRGSCTPSSTSTRRICSSRTGSWCGVMAVTM